MDAHPTPICTDDAGATSAPLMDATRADDSDADTATGQVLSWESPALSLALERVFEFYLADENDLHLQGKTSAVARAEAARWIAGCAAGPLRGSPEFCAAARRAIRTLSLVCKRIAGVCVHQWAGLAGLDRPPDDAREGTRGSITLVVGGAGSGKSYASRRLCSAMSQAMARASGRPDAPCIAADCMIVEPHSDRPLDEDAAHYLSLRPHARAALVHAEGRDYMGNAEKLCARGFHVVVVGYPTVDAPRPDAVDRVLVALGPRDSRCRYDALSANVASIVGVDPTALKVLFDAAPDYAYLWFEPVDGRFGPDRTVMTLSRASDFETADGSAPPLDPCQVL
ncbi:hypothetical protein pqer_cds_832 [Pandoravirus quercus]|uniref:Zeta toxin domain-containing protein n=2 Tax=Pandoravirus TaxID=2060084 RepID=A0A2U7U9Y8_9VIRU|nr:hypothetical protein pqer_cds_832 [Pandoravirus quercus]AVK75254.1 hypothetical protein pqer_cds_832 [Pandoravirus quercus]QBZ81427.1 hypothetical protein pclt_cds_840 [Pandoravirus celtis]